MVQAAEVGEECGVGEEDLVQVVPRVPVLPQSLQERYCQAVRLGLVLEGDAVEVEEHQMLGG